MCECPLLVFAAVDIFGTQWLGKSCD